MNDPSTALPPGWTISWDTANGRNVYIDTTTGRSQLYPPAFQGGANGMMNAQPRFSMEQQHPQPAFDQVPPNVGSGRAKRLYAHNQADAYYGDGAPSGMPYSHAPPHVAQGDNGFFAPGEGHGVVSSQRVDDGFQRRISPQHHHAGPAHPLGGSAAGEHYPAPVDTVSHQFQNLGLDQRSAPFQTLNLMGAPIDPALLDRPPPPIRLPPGSCISQSPFANADPSYQRSTLNVIPTTESLLKKSKIPLALIITPYRSIQAGDPEVPVVTDTVIARCRRCRTYINPFVTFIEGGNRWKCCMCNLSNEVPQLFDWDQTNNRPADRWQRAELNHSVVEFVAPTEYMVRAPQPPTYIFLLDVSHSAVSSGMLATAARTLLETLDRLPNQESRTRLCIIGVDSALHFFTLQPGNAEPAMLVVGDLDDVFLPKPDDLLANLTECRNAIETLLSRVNEMFKDTHSVGSAMGPALQAAYKLISATGGKIMVLSASLPTVGPGALKQREDVKLLGTAKESSLLQAATGFYKTFAIDCSRSQVSVDMWLFASGYTDVATLSCLPRYTGGNTFFYPAFNASRSEDALKFAHEFGEVVASPICLEAVMRVRASRGIRLSAFHGNFFVRSTDLLALPAVPMDQSYAIELQIEDPLSTNVAVFQTAVLHTTSSGERHIRVVTLALPTTTNLSELYGSADQVAIATLIANKAVERSMQARLEDARDAVTNKLVDVLGSFKTTMTSAGVGPSMQLMTSENLRLLPILMLGLLKHVGLRQSSQIPSDMRAYAQALLTTLPSQLLIPFLYPTLYSLHNMPKESGTLGEHGVILPPALNASSERFERHGLFLIEDGQNLFLWVGRDAVSQLIVDVFDLPSYAELRGGKATLPSLDNPFSKRVNAIVGSVRERRRGPHYPHLYIVKEDGEPSLRMWALSCLVEDRQDALPSYQQYLSTLKEAVSAYK